MEESLWVSASNGLLSLCHWIHYAVEMSVHSANTPHTIVIESKSLRAGAQPEPSNYFEWFEPQLRCVGVFALVYYRKKPPTVKISYRDSKCRRCIFTFHTMAFITISPLHTWYLFCDKILGTRFISGTQLKLRIKETPSVFCSNARTQWKGKTMLCVYSPSAFMCLIHIGGMQLKALNSQLKMSLCVYVLLTSVGLFVLHLQLYVAELKPRWRQH